MVSETYHWSSESVADINDQWQGDSSHTVTIVKKSWHIAFTDSTPDIHIGFFLFEHIFFIIQVIMQDFS